MNSNFAKWYWTPCCTERKFMFLYNNTTRWLDGFVVEARWLMNIVVCNLWIQSSAFTKQADIELVVALKESYVPL